MLTFFTCVITHFSGTSIKECSQNIAGIHHITAFAQIFASVWTSFESQSQFAYFGQSEMTDFTEYYVVYDVHRYVILSFRL